MIHNVYICPNYNTLDVDKQKMINGLKFEKFRFIFEVNIKLVDVDLMTKYFEIIKQNNMIIQKLVETVIILNGSNPVKTTVLKTFLKMIKKERPVRIIQ